MVGKTVVIAQVIYWYAAITHKLIPPTTEFYQKYIKTKQQQKNNNKTQQHTPHIHFLI